MPRNETRKEPELDHYVRASVEQARNRHDRNGRYKTLTLRTDTSDYDEAREQCNALYRSAYHLNVSLDADMTRDTDGRYLITFTAVHPKYKDRWSSIGRWRRNRKQQ